MSFRGVLHAVAALEGFTAVTAIGGRIALTSGLEGARLAIELLRATPFRSYQLPGVILGGMVGGTPLHCISARGTVLMGWIVGEALILGARDARSRVQAGYFARGLLMATFGVVMWLVDHCQPRAVRMTASDSPN